MDVWPIRCRAAAQWSSCVPACICACVHASVDACVRVCGGGEGGGGQEDSTLSKRFSAWMPRWATLSGWSPIAGFSIPTAHRLTPLVHKLSQSDVVFACSKGAPGTADMPPPLHAPAWQIVDGAPGRSDVQGGLPGFPALPWVWARRLTALSAQRASKSGDISPDS